MLHELEDKHQGRWPSKVEDKVVIVADCCDAAEHTQVHLGRDPSQLVMEVKHRWWPRNIKDKFSQRVVELHEHEDDPELLPQLHEGSKDAAGELVCLICSGASAVGIGHPLLLLPLVEPLQLNAKEEEYQRYNNRDA